MELTFLNAFARSRKFVPVHEMKPAHNTFESFLETFRRSSQKHLILLPEKLFSKGWARPMVSAPGCMYSQKCTLLWLKMSTSTSCTPHQDQQLGASTSRNSVPTTYKLMFISYIISYVYGSKIIS